jgi:MFS superfamily sulfate permease-like transporter
MAPSSKSAISRPIEQGVVMAVVIVAFGGLVGHLAMPALAGLLMLIGYRTIKVADLRSVWKTGAVQKAVLVTTFALTMVVPLQYAVLVGVGVSVILHVVRQSTRSPSGDGSSTPRGIRSRPTPRPCFRPRRWLSCSHMEACSSPPRRCLSRVFLRRAQPHGTRW